MLIITVVYKCACIKQKKIIDWLTKAETATFQSCSQFTDSAEVFVVDHLKIALFPVAVVFVLFDLIMLINMITNTHITPHKIPVQ